MKQQTQYHKGQRVTVTRGPYKGNPATYRGLHPNGWHNVEIHLPGRSTLQPLPDSYIQPENA